MTPKDIDGQPLCSEGERLVEYLRTRSAALDVAAIRERVHAAAQELEKALEGVPEAGVRARPIPNKWTIAEVADHTAQTQIRSAEELRHLFAGRRPPGPPVYEALRSGAAAWAPWRDLLDGVRSANREMVELLAAAPGRAEQSGAKVATIVVVSYRPNGGDTRAQIFPMDLGWREYALLQRLHLLDHRTQVKKLREALAAAAAGGS